MSSSVPRPGQEAGQHLWSTTQLESDPFKIYCYK